jgi:hypothetical protein
MADDSRQRAKHAFDLAVAREREAIAVHESAAQKHEDTAVRFEALAEATTDRFRRHSFNRQAATERLRAAAARSRADESRRRLWDDGVTDP